MVNSTMSFNRLGEHGVDLTSDKIRYMYYLKRNSLDKGRAYILCVFGYGLHLKLLDSFIGWKDKTFILLDTFGVMELSF